MSKESIRWDKSTLVDIQVERKVVYMMMKKLFAFQVVHIWHQTLLSHHIIMYRSFLFNFRSFPVCMPLVTVGPKLVCMPLIIVGPKLERAVERKDEKLIAKR